MVMENLKREAAVNLSNVMKTLQAQMDEHARLKAECESAQKKIDDLTASIQKLDARRHDLEVTIVALALIELEQEDENYGS